MMMIGKSSEFRCVQASSNKKPEKLRFFVAGRWLFLLSASGNRFIDLFFHKTLDEVALWQYHWREQLPVGFSGKGGDGVNLSLCR